jgi:hypothetical protein
VHACQGHIRRPCGAVAHIHAAAGRGLQLARALQVGTYNKSLFTFRTVPLHQLKTLFGFFKCPNQYRMPGLLHPFKSKIPKIDLNRLNLHVIYFKKEAVSNTTRLLLMAKNTNAIAVDDV